MIRFLMICVLCLGAMGGVSYAAEQRFFSNISDLPLMAGLYEVPDAMVVFDKEDGRIVESTAAGEGVETTDILAFYAATLPQLGWRAVGDNTYVRGRENLQLRVEKDGRVGVLRVLLAPLSQP